MIGFYLVVGAFVLATLGFEGNSPPGERAWVGTILVLSAALIVAGLRLVGRHRALGMGMLLLGAVPLALAMNATIIVPLASGAAILTGAVRLVKPPVRHGRII